MPRTLAALFIVLLPAAGAAADTWQADYDAARAAAKTQRKPIFLTFRCER